MARTLTAYLKREDVPVRKALQQAIDKLAFQLKLDDGYAPFETSGYLPCTLDGEDAGFDLRFKEAGADGSNVSDMGARSTKISCKWGGDPREEASALIVCAALVNDFQALVKGGDEFLTGEQLLGLARAALD
jgi:hypothetical protein